MACPAVFADPAAGASVSLNSHESDAGTGTTVTMWVGTDAELTPVAFSGTAYASDSRISITSISGLAGSISSDTSTGYFSWADETNEAAFSSWASVSFWIPEELPAGSYTLGVTSMYAEDIEGNALLTSSLASSTFTVNEVLPPPPPIQKAGVYASANKSEVTSGTASTVTMTVRTDGPIIPASFSGTVYSSNSRITVSSISGIDKSVSSSGSGFSWSGAADSEISGLASVVFSIPADMPSGSYTLGVNGVSAYDASGNDLLTSYSGSVSLTVNPAPVVLTGISVKSGPNKTDYEDGQTFDSTGLVLLASFSDGTSQEITTGYTVPESLLAEGMTSVTISYEGKTASVPITVKKPIVMVSSVTLNKTSTTILEEGTEGLTVTVAPANATNKAVTWSSDHPEIATVSNGTVTAIKEGTATITVKAIDGSEKSASCVVTVSKRTIPVTGVSLSRTSLSMTEDETYTITATVSPSTATNQNVSWSSSNYSVASVSGGRIVAVAPGSATITATTADGSFYASCSVSVKAAVVYVSGVSLNKHETSMIVGGTESLTAVVSPSNATNKNVSWSSDDSSVVTVSGGTLTAVDAGYATVTVRTTDGGWVDSCVVHVSYDQVPVTGISLDKSKVSITAGESEVLIALISPVEATDQNVIWSSSDDKIVSVEGGVLTANGVGSATVTAESADGGYTASCEVKVVKTTYKITEGDGTSWEKGGLEGLNFRSSAKPEEFSYVKVDGKKVPADSINWKDGLLTLNAEYLESLRLGKHTVTIESKNGSATGQFMINDGEKAESECPHEHTNAVGSRPANCSHEGCTGDVYCLDCGELIRENEVIEKTDHYFVQGRCIDCGAKDPNWTEKSSGMPQWLMWAIPLAAAGIIGGGVAAFLSKRRKALEALNEQYVPEDDFMNQEDT